MLGGHDYAWARDSANKESGGIGWKFFNGKRKIYDSGNNIILHLYALAHQRPISSQTFHSPHPPTQPRISLDSVLVGVCKIHPTELLTNYPG